MNSGRRQRLELCEQVSKECTPKRHALIRNFRPRICYVLSLLRIDRPECEDCIARQRYGHELRERLEELDGRVQPPSHESQDPLKLPRAG